jgi:hypothetical protein
MTDEIVRFAQEVGARSEPASGWWEFSPKALERFAALVAAAEREACAEVCDRYGMPSGTSQIAAYLAAGIRSRRYK